MDRIDFEEYPAEDLGPALAAQVAEDLIAALDARGRASLAVPGGTTPVFFLRALGRVDLDWSRVSVTLTDERRVSATHPRSNQRLLSETLFAGRAAAARFVPLAAGPEDDLEAISLGVEAMLPLDVCVLGMGEDMHTASLFPGAVGLETAMAPEAPTVAAITASQAEEPRITLTLPVLREARQRYLLIKGAAKRAVLEEAMDTDPRRAPIRAVLDAGAPVGVFYAA